MYCSIIRHWQKLPAVWRQHIQVLMLTILIYALLLVLFRPVTPAPATAFAAAGTVQPIVLNNAENADLALWMQHHDPSAMIEPDRQHGYSQALDKTAAHQQPEDLPAPPPLSLPQMPEMAQLKPAATPRSNIMPQPGNWNISKKPTAAPSAGQPAVAYLNSRRTPELEKIAAELLAGEKIEVSNSNLQTILRVEPARLDGQLHDITVVQKSKVDKLDTLAVSTVYYYMQKNPDALRKYDNITLIWRIEDYKKEQTK